jgi:hypothetical protein
VSKGIRFSRRSLLRKGSAVLAGSAAATGVAATHAEAQVLGTTVSGSSLAAVKSVSADGSLVLKSTAGSRVVEVVDLPSAALQLGASLLDQPNGSDIHASDPVPGETWRAGDEVVVVEQFTNATWTIVDLQRMYRSFEGGTVVSRQGSSLLLDSGDEIQLTATTTPRSSAEGYEAVPLADITVGATVAGIMFRTSTESEDCWLPVVQIGVRSA